MRLIGLSALLTSSLLFTVASGATQQADVTAAEDEVRSVIELYFQMFRTGDADLLPRVMAQDPDMVVLGTDADERFVGWEQNAKRFERMFKTIEFRKISLSHLVIKVSRSGDVAWFSVISDWDILAEGNEIILKGIRSTGVLEKRDGNWIIVQYHASAPVRGQVVEY